MNAIDKSRLFLACLAIAEQESREPHISEAVFAGMKEDAARDMYDEARAFGVVGGEVMEFGPQHGGDIPF